jgi:hypothetical protein
MRTPAHGRFPIVATLPPDFDCASRHIIYYAAAVFYKGENPQPHPAPAYPHFDMPTAVGINIVRHTMTRYQKILVGLSAFIAAMAICLAKFPFPVQGDDIEAYLHVFSFYFLAVIPPALTAYAAQLAKEKPWAYRTVTIFWSAAVVITALCLIDWVGAGGWSGIAWYISSEGWLVGAILLVLFGATLRYFTRRKMPNHFPQPTQRAAD